MNQIIYVIRNISNGRKYVGKTNNIRNRWNNHVANAKKGMKLPMYDEMRTQGIGNFKIETLASTTDAELAETIERFFIKRLNSLDPVLGYNVREGGRKGKHCESTKIKMRLAVQGENHHSKQLTARKVLFIRSKFDSKESSVKELAKAFNVSLATIRFIVKRKTWKHII